MTSILLVEDDYQLGPMMVKRLEAKGYVVYFATNYSQAHELIDLDGPFDVILTDYEFPGGNGLDVIEYALYSAGNGGKSDKGRVNDITEKVLGSLIIIWSGLNRTDEVNKRNLTYVVDHVLTKGNLDKLSDVLPPA